MFSINDKVLITNAKNDIWNNLMGIVEEVDIDTSTVTVLVDFKPNKKVRQNFSFEEVKKV